MISFDELRERALTPAEKKKREDVAQAIERDNPKMPMAKKMAIATATAKKSTNESSKLDKDFSRTVSEQDTQELVKFVVSICNNMELDMLAEGIETQEQQETFLKLGCDKGQGYFHHRPQFLEEFKEEF